MNLKDILWEGNSYEDLMSFPPSVRHDIGYQLHLVQSGQMPTDWKPLAKLGKAFLGSMKYECLTKETFFEQPKLQSLKTR